MAWERPILDIPAATAGSDFSTGNGYKSTGQYLFVKLSGDSAYVPCSSTKDLAIGVAQTNPASGDALQVRVLGVTKVFVGSGGLTAGDEVGTDAQGKAIKKAGTATGANYGEYINGVCIEGGAAGALATVMLFGPNAA